MSSVRSETRPAAAVCSPSPVSSDVLLGRPAARHTHVASDVMALLPRRPAQGRSHRPSRPATGAPRQLPQHPDNLFWGVSLPAHLFLLLGSLAGLSPISMDRKSGSNHSVIAVGVQGAEAITGKPRIRGWRLKGKVWSGRESAFMELTHLNVVLKFVRATVRNGVVVSTQQLLWLPWLRTIGSIAQRSTKIVTVELLLSAR